MLFRSLEAITENIVTQLDAKLKEAGYSVQSAKNARNKIDTIVSQLKVLANGRRKLFSDFASSGAKNDTGRFVQSAVGAFGEIEKLLSSLEQAVKAYISVTPNFIEEFLSPEGIITQKRAIDAHIQQNTAETDSKREKIASLKSQNSDLALKMEEYHVKIGRAHV